MTRLKNLSALFALLLLCTATVQGRDTYNFNLDWLLAVGDLPGGQQPALDDAAWRPVSLPRAFNEEEAFCLPIHQLTDTVVWYRKHFSLPADCKGKKVFIEFEGVRQGAEIYLNGTLVGLHENGVMAFGYDLTPLLVRGDNLLALRIDNSWSYRERESNSTYQWNNKNFNANYGGIPKNVWLHIAPQLHQTLPLYSGLKSTGQYVYATDIDVAAHRATVHLESQVCNSSAKSARVALQATLVDAEGRTVATFAGDQSELLPGQTAELAAAAPVEGLQLWSWGYGYLYTVKSTLLVNGKPADEVTLRTGFRKTAFGEGKIWINDRPMMVHGYAQRTSNEWPAVGMSVSPWMSDYSNALMVESGANVVRWMHVTPWRQDVESCDRVGLMQAMPAGDAEKDAAGRQWEQRVELMRDAIIYFRNNPSIIFYECGNESISREHMLQMLAVRDMYDPHGGRAMGSREMLDIDEAEYGGEMLYINKSRKHPMWAMEYCRDEGLRKYRDSQSYPYHPQGEGPLYRNADASDYNHNMDNFVVEHVRRWYDYYVERPGTGTRVSSGGVKIVFSDTNTHFRGAENYRRSGVVDAMRIPKESFYAHRVMWNGWVEPEEEATCIVGHWNYPAATVKSIYVVSTAERVELRLNGHSLGDGRQQYRYLFTFDNVAYAPGVLEAVGYDSEGHELSRDRVETVGPAARLRLALVGAKGELAADAADMALVEVEAVDSLGRRCPLDNRTVHFTLDGPAEWRGGIAQGPGNCILSRDLPLECGVNRVLLRSTRAAGNVTLTATAPGLQPVQVSLVSRAVKSRKGLTRHNPSAALPLHLQRGATPATPSYRELREMIPVASATAGCNGEQAAQSYDDNELSEWKNDGTAATAWIKYRFERPDTLHEICMKLTGWRARSYPLVVTAGDSVIFNGETPKSLGYVHLPVAPIVTDNVTVRLRGAYSERDAFGGVTELSAPDGNGNVAPEKMKSELRIVEIEFLKQLSSPRIPTPPGGKK